jgi:cell division protein FtsL
MKRTKLLLGFFISVILVLCLIQVIASNRISTAGIELAKLETAVKDIKRQNLLLREKILARSSLTRIASQAGEMGFVEAKSTLFIKAPSLARN